MQICYYILFSFIILATFLGIHFQPPNIHFLLIIFDKQIIFLLFFSWGNVYYSLFVSILKVFWKCKLNVLITFGD